MPMFDDPNRELRRLQEQLLAAEEEDFDDDYAGEDFDDYLEEGTAESEHLYRNYFNRYGADVRNFANGYRGEDLLDEQYDGYDDGYEDSYGDEEPVAVFRQEKRGLFGRKKEQSQQTPQSKEKGIWKLKIILLLEIIGILCLLIWWVVTLC